MKNIKYILYIIIFTLIGGNVAAQSSGQYTLPAEYNGYQVDVVKGEKVITKTYNGLDYNTSIAYFDELGRTCQTIQLKASPAGNHLVGFVEYDNMGRSDSVAYMPYAEPSTIDTSGKIANIKQRQQQFYSSYLPSNDPDKNYAYTETKYDSSPLSAVTATYGTGKNGHDNPVIIAYDTNAYSYGLRKYSVDNANRLVFDNQYHTNNVTVKEITSKISNTTSSISREYTNSLGQVIAKSTHTNINDIRITYYVYDDKGNLRYIIPPILNDSIQKGNYEPDSPEMSKYWYYTEYDKYGRVTRSLAPGAAWQYFVYDKAHRVVLSQDGNLRGSSQDNQYSHRWIYTAYDHAGRAVYQGIVRDTNYSKPRTQSELQLIYDNLAVDTTPFVKYAPNVSQVPDIAGFVAVNTLSSVRFGDNLELNSKKQFAVPQYLSFKQIGDFKISVDKQSPKNGVKIYERVAALDGTKGEIENNDFIERAFYYDDKGRLVQTVEKNYLGYVSRYSTKYNDIGEAIQTHEAHQTEEDSDVKYVRYITGLYILVTHPFSTVAPLTYIDPTNKYFDENGYIYEKHLILTTSGPGSLYSSYYYIPEDCFDVVDATMYTGPQTSGSNIFYHMQDIPGELKTGYYEKYIPMLNYYLCVNSPDINVDLTTIDPQGLFFESSTSIRKEFKIGESTSSGIGGLPVTRYFYYIPEDCSNIIQALQESCASIQQQFKPYYTVDFIPIGTGGNLITGFWRYYDTFPDHYSDTKTIKYEYDRMGRLLSETTSVNNGNPVKVKYNYDSLGKIRSKTLASKNMDTKVNQGWVLKYNTALSKEERNGNLKSILYEMMNRIGLAESMEPAGSTLPEQLTDLSPLLYTEYPDLSVFEYMDDNNDINPAYFICQDSANPDYSYYYFPFNEWWNYDGVSNQIAKYELSKGLESGIFVATANIPTSAISESVQYTLKKSFADFFTEKYNYRLSGMLRDQNSDIFSMSVSTDNYTNMITGQEWDNVLSSSNNYHTAAFEYDGFGQLIGGQCETEHLSVEYLMRYDKNGNITLNKHGIYNNAIHRYVANSFDAFYYDGNQMYCLGASYFQYDSNGNMIIDGRTGLHYSYNCLNLLGRVSHADNVLPGCCDDAAFYTWLADGSKARAIDQHGGGFLYLGSFTYKRGGGENDHYSNNTNKWQLESTGFAGGRFIAAETTGGTVLEHVLYVTDYLGNVRAAATGSMLNHLYASYNNYHPYGERWSSDEAAADGRFLFNGKEAYTVGGHNTLLDYGARMYDPKLMQWFNPDPAHQFASPYTFCGNNPICYVDPDGRFAILGAAIIGAVMNTMMNAKNIDSFAEGLGYFFVGAMSGAMGAGVGAGVSAALAGGSFGAGFIGSAGAKVATSSFLNGAAIGASSGFVSGFTAGAGNSLMAKNDFGTAMKTGLLNGLIGAVSGAFVGGMYDGFAAMADDRTFMTGQPWELVQEYSLPNDTSLPIVQQKYEAGGCTQCVYESINEYKTGIYSRENHSTGSDFLLYAKNKGWESATQIEPNIYAIGGQISRGNPVAVTYSTGNLETPAHTVAINKITIHKTPRVFNPSAYRFRYNIQVMDPLKSSYVTLPYSTFRSGVSRVLEILY